MAFATDVFSRKIAGWSVSSTLKADMMALQAPIMSLWNMSDGLTGLIHQCDSRSNYISLTSANQIVEPGETSPVGSESDSDDNAMAESWFVLFKTEVIKKSRPWKP